MQHIGLIKLSGNKKYMILKISEDMFDKDIRQMVDEAQKSGIDLKTITLEMSNEKFDYLSFQKVQRTHYLGFPVILI